METLNYAWVSLGRTPGPVWRFFLRPPGWPMHVLTLAALIGLLNACSAPGTFSLQFLCFGLLGIGLAGIWILRLGLSFIGKCRFCASYQSPARSWRRWAVGPSVALILLLLCGLDIPLHVRFALSRNALNRLIPHALATGPKPLWTNTIPVAGPFESAGGYRVAVVQITDSGDVYFQVQGTGVIFETYCGFVYAPAEKPTDSEGSFTPLGGGWYAWEHREFP